LDFLIGVNMCDHKNVFVVGGKTSDTCSWSFPDGQRDDGYIPDWSGFSEYGDYISFEVCLDCKQALNIDVEGILAAMNEDDEDSEEDEYIY
tara:strand:- start:6526 stop:6798 length:273 start_codon:yes stop_codon:yes gene_type:complete